MGKPFISFGNFSKKHLYIVYSIIFLIAKDILTGYNYNNCFKEVYSSATSENFSIHALVNNIFCYMGTFILSFIFFIIEQKRNISHSNSILDKQNKKTEIQLHSLKIEYIHTPKKNLYFSQNTIYGILFVIFLWIVEENAIQIYSFLKDLDFWMIEIIIVCLLNSYMFNLKIYRHQFLIIFFNIIPIILKIVTIILSLKDDGNIHSEKKNDYEYYFFNGTHHNPTGRLKSLYVIYKWIIPIGIICYLLLITLRSYVNSKIKEFMDLKYISANKLLMIYSAMGTIICTIVCTITTFEKCEETKEPSKKDIYDYFCLVNNTNRDSKITIKYFDNFKIYASNAGNAFLEILRILLEIVFFFFNKYFSILIIKFFTPVHLIISFPVYYLILKIILIINTVIRVKGHTFFDDTKELNFKTAKFLLDISGDITSILGFLVYLEILELNFCKFNYNLRNNIISRAELELLWEDQEDDRPSIDEEGLKNMEIGDLNESNSD